MQLRNRREAKASAHVSDEQVPPPVTKKKRTGKAPKNNMVELQLRKGDTDAQSLASPAHNSSQSNSKAPQAMAKQSNKRKAIGNPAQPGPEVPVKRSHHKKRVPDQQAIITGGAIITSTSAHLPPKSRRRQNKAVLNSGSHMSKSSTKVAALPSKAVPHKPTITLSSTRPSSDRAGDLGSLLWVGHNEFAKNGLAPILPDGLSPDMEHVVGRIPDPSDGEEYEQSKCQIQSLLSKSTVPRWSSLSYQTQLIIVRELSSMMTFNRVLRFLELKLEDISSFIEQWYSLYERNIAQTERREAAYAEVQSESLSHGIRMSSAEYSHASDLETRLLSHPENVPVVCIREEEVQYAERFLRRYRTYEELDMLQPAIALNDLGGFVVPDDVPPRDVIEEIVVGIRDYQGTSQFWDYSEHYGIFEWYNQDLREDGDHTAVNEPYKSSSAGTAYAYEADLPFGLGSHKCSSKCSPRCNGLGRENHSG